MKTRQIKLLKNSVLLILSLGASIAFGQNVGINETGTAPDASAILDIDATDKGLLIPRVALTSTSTAAPVTSPTASLLVYNTDTAGDVTSGYYYWNGSAWTRLLIAESPDWRLAGNTGTNPAMDYLGTTDAQPLVFRTNGVERMRLSETSALLSLGHTLPERAIDVRGTSLSTTSIETSRHSDNAFGGYFAFYKSRGSSINSHGDLVSGDDIGTLDFYGSNAGAWESAAQIKLEAQGTSLQTRYRLDLNDGTGLQRRLTIDDDGEYKFNDAISVTGASYMFYPSDAASGKNEAYISSFGDTSEFGGCINLVHGRGLWNAKTPALDNDRLGVLTFGGYYDAGTISTLTTIEARATENFSATNAGTEMIFSTGGIGSAFTYERLRLTDNGKFGFNTYSLDTTYNADVHILSTNVDSVGLFLGAGNTGSGSDAILTLAEDHDNSFNMSIRYDGAANQLRIEGKNSTTLYPNLVTIDRNTGNSTFAGDLSVTGTLSKGGGTFKIDHPNDPANKYLLHSFVESPDMMNVYNGNITTDANGDAVVELPDYFESLNKDFRYQLTVMGTFAQAIIQEKVNGNTFSIKTSEPNVEVSWQVTGIRKDAWANHNRVVPETEKADWEKGYYLHPEAHNVSTNQGMNHAVRPEASTDNDKHPLKSAKVSVESPSEQKEENRETAEKASK